VNAPETALRHQQLTARAVQLRHRHERDRAGLESQAEVDDLRQQVASAEERLAVLNSGLHDWEREVGLHRARMQSRQRDLMSGRLKNSAELIKLDHEVQGLKLKLSQEEDRELELMEEQEAAQATLRRLGAELLAAAQRVDAARPALQARVRSAEAELAQVEAERDSLWSALPPEWQAVYSRVESRLADPVAQVEHAQCQSCRVGLTSSGLQVLRRGQVLLCDNCGRLLVMV